MVFEQEMQVSQTEELTISAAPVLVDENATQGLLWGYYLCIENNSNHKIHLLGKNWNITDDRGNRYSDESMGFKGEIPELNPGEYFEFTSTAPLESPNAVFYGSCKIRSEGQKMVREVRIPTFTLSAARDNYSAVLN